MRSRHQSWLWVLLAVAISVARGQQPGDASAAAPQTTEPLLPMHTLHVYMDLIQVPVLVLDSERQRMKPIRPASFFVSLDEGPVFHPKNVRQEGDDPITLGILLDPNTERDLMPRMSDAIAGLAPKSLQPHDHVTLYAMDCSLLRTLEDVPAGPAELKSGVDRALARWTERRRIKPPPDCARPVSLWDAMALASSELGKLPGRRILLVASNGIDGGSRHSSGDLRLFAQEKGIAIFGYREGQPRSPEAWPRGRGGFGMPSGPGSGESEEETFSRVCELTGGMVMPADPQFVGRELARFVTFVRERYILEFSRPRNGEPGQHVIAVTLPRAAPFAFIRSAGVSIVNRGVAADEDLGILPDDSGAPVYGPKKPPKPM